MAIAVELVALTLPEEAVPNPRQSKVLCPCVSDTVVSNVWFTTLAAQQTQWR